ncbi:benzoate/H(+) symporter BenE family transporter [Trinickia sp. NRRL B-1857]|uniref:benzoate/H(+) symporter BenE family transporter n=1 Tax=Trinickia sp. NRRL B-1857 TaxID=3162879 RepID=UPI003D27294F
MRRFFADFSGQSAAMGIFAAIVGYTSSVAVVINGMLAVGASHEQAASGLAILGVTMGFTAIGLSLVSRIPISIAWTLPGMALLSTLPVPAGGYSAAVGAFIVTGMLIVLAGLWTQFGRLVTRIPGPIANAMLAGILFKLCLAPFDALHETPKLAALVILTWLVVGRFHRLWAAPAALLVAVASMSFAGPQHAQTFSLPALAWVSPRFDWHTVVSIALPLFIVTMASQNIPGFAVLSTYGYEAPARPSFLATGAASAISALLGAPGINLAAVTAALCAGPDAHAQPERRYPAAVVAGLVYAVVLPPVSSIVITLVSASSSPILIEAAAGLALTGAFSSSLFGAMRDEQQRLPALATFLVTASGFSLYGIGGAFWGLCAGLVIHLLYAVRRSGV